MEATEENLRDACKIAKQLYEEELRIAAQAPTGTISKKKVLLETYWEKYISDLEAKVQSGKNALRIPTST